MGERRQTGTPSEYLTSHASQLSPKHSYASIGLPVG